MICALPWGKKKKTSFLLLKNYSLHLLFFNCHFQELFLFFTSIFQNFLHCLIDNLHSSVYSYQKRGLETPEDRSYYLWILSIRHVCCAMVLQCCIFKVVFFFGKNGILNFIFLCFLVSIICSEKFFNREICFCFCV